MLRDISWRYFDFWLLGAVVLDTAFGTTMIRSAVAGNEELLPLINRQIYFALAGLVLIFVVAAIDYSFWMAIYRPIFIVKSLLLFFLFLSAQAVFGAARWFQVGVLFVQPTEFAKIASILLLARYFDKAEHQPRNLRWILFAFLWVMGLAIWILLQPNLSNVVVLMVILASLLWFNGMQVKHIALFGGIGLFVVGIIIALSVAGVDVPFLQDYQQQRIVNFVIPDPNATFGETYNIDQAKIAIGSGGLTGKGFLQGTQTKFDFVPEQSTDFIFCTVGEEWGFAGTSVILLLYLMLLYRILFIAERQKSAFTRIYAYGVASIFFFHLLVNIGMTIGLLPVIGIPLPFFSYGGSSLWSFTILLFILIRLDSYRTFILR